MTIQAAPAKDLRIFNAVMAHNALDASEIELCKDAYRRDPEAARATYNALATEIPPPVDTQVFVKFSSPPPSG